MIQPAASSPSNSLALSAGASAAQGDGAGVSASFAALLSSSRTAGGDNVEMGGEAASLAVDARAESASGKSAGNPLPLGLPELDEALADAGQPAGADGIASAGAGAAAMPATRAETFLSGLVLLQTAKPASMLPSTLEPVDTPAVAPATGRQSAETIRTASAARLARTGAQAIRSGRIDTTELAHAAKPEKASRSSERPDDVVPSELVGSVLPPLAATLVAIAAAEPAGGARSAASAPTAGAPVPANAGAQILQTGLPGSPRATASIAAMTVLSNAADQAAPAAATPVLPNATIQPTPTAAMPVLPNATIQPTPTAAMPVLPNATIQPTPTAAMPVLPNATVQAAPAAAQIAPTALSQSPGEAPPVAVLTAAPMQPLNDTTPVAIASPPERPVGGPEGPSASSAADPAAPAASPSDTPDGAPKLASPSLNQRDTAVQTAKASADPVTVAQAREIAAQTGSEHAVAKQPAGAEIDLGATAAQPAWSAPASAPPATAAASVPAAEPTRQAGHDFAALVDRLVEARQAAAPQSMHAAVAHSEFGEVTLRFDQDAAGLSVSMSSADPEFARAVQASVAAGPQTPADDGSAGPRQDAGGQQQNAGSPAGQPQSQSNPQASARNDRNTPAQTEARTRADRESSDHQPNDAGGDIYA